MLCFYSAVPCSVAYYAAGATAQLLSKRATYWRRVGGHFIRSICNVLRLGRRKTAERPIRRQQLAAVTKSNMPEKDLWKMLLTCWDFLTTFGEDSKRKQRLVVVQGSEVTIGQVTVKHSEKKKPLTDCVYMRTTNYCLRLTVKRLNSNWATSWIMRLLFRMCPAPLLRCVLRSPNEESSTLTMVFFLHLRHQFSSYWRLLMKTGGKASQTTRI